ncbi:MAG: PQQ-dependent sugar dehydrogenase [Candidatus Pelagibacter bacterium]|nr:PQQ-dependent sugar dehydrogenase [Candidatus Pelagibacter bacterium]MBL6861153.1 PQQ-dependent sugar dehydrogenase [Candidatus Pelagibacter bacterium]
MKKITLIILVFFFQVFSIFANEPKLYQIINGLNSPWSLTFIDNNRILLTEKSGNILLVNLKNKKTRKIKHNLNILEDGQGGLLEVLYYNNQVFVTYTENREKGNSSTSTAKARFNDVELIFQNIFRAEPPINSGYHFGSRLVVKDDFIYITVGERGEGMIAQDPKKHPGSIIRIHLDGKIPKDNPKFKDKKDWLPEIYQIGVRNPQGMDLSPFDNKIYLTNHGAKGGDWFGEVKYGENYGWKILGWGGTNYTGTQIGPKWMAGFTKAIKYWVPSIAASSMVIYKGEEFKEWNGDALITSLRDQSLRKIRFKDNNFINEKIIFKDKIGRIRDIEIQENTGKIFLLTDEGSIWRLEK